MIVTHNEELANMADRKLTIPLDDAARTWLANRGYDPAYGARLLKRKRLKPKLKQPKRPPQLEAATPMRRVAKPIEITA